MPCDLFGASLTGVWDKYFSLPLLRRRVFPGRYLRSGDKKIFCHFGKSSYLFKNIIERFSCYDYSPIACGTAPRDESTPRQRDCDGEGVGFRQGVAEGAAFRRTPCRMVGRRQTGPCRRRGQTFFQSIIAPNFSLLRIVSLYLRSESTLSVWVKPILRNRCDMLRLRLL